MSGLFIRRGTAAPRSRLQAMAIAAMLAPMGALIAAGVAIEPMLALAAIVGFAHLVFQVNLGALIVDLYPTRIVATVFGFVAAGSGIGGILSTQLVGRLVTTQSWDSIFLMMAVLHPAAVLIAWLSLRSQSVSVLRVTPATNRAE